MTTLPSDPRSRHRELSIDDYATGILAGDRAILGRAITLIESRRADHQLRAQELIAKILPHTGKAHRIGITGPPGVGKSTLLESLGMLLIEQRHRLAVLAIDPSSSVSGGSILGDKMRMARLATSERAFIRPSPSGGSLGGVTHQTRTAILLCEAAGYDVIFVETMGVGQSEAVVADMVDSVLLLLLPGAGDELQFIKRGLLEVVDMIAVAKADGKNISAAKQTQTRYLSALRYVRRSNTRWTPPVLTCSGLKGLGLEEVWTMLEEHRKIQSESGEFERKRRAQLSKWIWSIVEDEILGSVRHNQKIKTQLADLEPRVLDGEITPNQAARRLLRTFGGLASSGESGNP